jgi:4-hydroxy-tetrahydrodipicolinate synthase
MFTGCGTALVTPFRSDGSLDEDALRALVRWQLESGIHFLVPCGTTGESPTLTKQEHLRVVQITLEEAKGKVPILAGCGGYCTSEIAGLAADLEKMEVDGLLSVTPYYNKPTPDGLYQHYTAIARATQLPIVVYNVPSRTGTNIKPDTLARLASIDNVVGVKEASGDIGQFAEIFQVVPKAFSVLSGDDSVTLALMALGGVGLISVASNEIPAEMSRLCEACAQGDYEGARKIHRRYHALMEINFTESSPGPVKWALSVMGRIQPNYRLPMVPPTDESKAKIEQVLAGVGLNETVASAD